MQGYSHSSLGLSSALRVAPPLPPMVGGATKGAYGSGGAPSYAERDSYGADYAVDESMPKMGVMAPTVMPYPIPPTAPMGNVKMVRTADLSLLVRDTDETARAIDAIRLKYGGYAGNSSFTEYVKGIRQGSMTIWVPSDKLDLALADIRTLAIRVGNDNVNAEDVSGQFADLDARLKNAKAAEAVLLDLMKRSGDVKDVLQVAQALQQTRGEIESYQGSLNQLSQRAAFSSITVSITPEASPSAEASAWRPWGVAKEAFSNVVRDLKSFANMLIAGTVGLIALIPMLLFWALILWVLYKMGRRVANALMKKT